MSAELHHKELTLTFGGKPTPFTVGDKVRTRGDIGSIRGLTVREVHNDWYCKCTRFPFDEPLHFNMAFLVPDA